MPERELISQEEWAIWRSFFDMRRGLERLLEQQLHHDAGISGPDYTVLVALFEASDRRMRIGELGTALAWEKSRLSHQIGRMESRQLVIRTECDLDGRGTWIGITPTGRRAVLGATREHSSIIRKYFFDLLSDDERDALAAITDRVLAAIGPDAGANPDAGSDAIREHPPESPGT